MNRERRARIATMTRRIDAELRLMLDEFQTELADLIDEEEDARDSLPDALRDGERAQAMDDAITALESARDIVDSWTREVDDLDDNLTTASE